MPNNPIYVESAHPVTAVDVTDTVLVERWILARSASPHTRRAYLKEANRFLSWMQDRDLRLLSVHDYEMAAYGQFLSQDIGLQSRSIRFALSAIKSLFSYLKRNSLIATNPAEAVSLPSLPPRILNTYLSQEESAYVYRCILERQKTSPAPELVRQRWIFMLAYYTGMRREEIASGGMADFAKHRKKSGDEWWLSIKGKGNKERLVPASKALMRELAVYRTTYGLPPEPSRHESFGLVFRLAGPSHAYKDKDRISSSSVYEAIKALLESIAKDCKDDELRERLQGVSTHWMRHGHATALLDNTGDLRLVRENLGHADLKTTQQYLHSSDQARRDGVESLSLESIIDSETPTS